MASLFDATYKALTGRTTRLEYGPAANKVAFLERKYKSMAEVSRRTGIPRTTLRRWKSGKEPKVGQDVRLNRALRDSLVPPGRRKRVANSTGKPELIKGEVDRGFGHGGLTITAEVTISSDTRERTLAVGRHISGAAGDRLLGAFLVGDDDAFESDLYAALTTYFGSSGWIVTSVSNVSFDPIR